MPREYYQLANVADLNSLKIELNRILESISNRLNLISISGDNIDAGGGKITNLAAGTAETDALRKDQAFLISNLASILLGTTDEITITDNGDNTLTFSLPSQIKLDGATAGQLLGTDANQLTQSVSDISGFIDLSPLFANIVCYENTVVCYENEVVTI